MKIGNIEFGKGIFLAPLAGITDRAFRVVCAQNGADCVTTEMISAKGVCYNDIKTEKLASLENDLRPAGIQLFGAEESFLTKAAYRLCEYNPDFFDINMGCPMRKITSAGEGSALLKTPKKCGELVKVLKKAVDKPITAKIRIGYENKNINAVEVAKYLEDGGVDAITVHGRTREMMYSGKANLDVIRSVKQAVSVPVIGNGDIFDGESAKRMFEQTGCDGIMVARGVLGKPWIFNEIKAYLKNEPYTPPTMDEIRKILMHQLDMASHIAGKEYLLTMRKQISWYSKGIPGSAEARRKINVAHEMEEFTEIIESLFV